MILCECELESGLDGWYIDIFWLFVEIFDFDEVFYLIG
jgi:hypothetical protein